MGGAPGAGDVWGASGIEVGYEGQARLWALGTRLRKDLSIVGSCMQPALR